ncbi:MAG: hypothetical protein J1F02_02165 [Lachnospiraceae bacterium]|nr:hypothetical protein [Lachnospiraceae bacterium]
MKKFFKFLLCVSAAIAAIGGVLYFLKNILMKDYLDDYDDDDFDNDLYDEEEENRDYVTITPDSDAAKANDAADEAEAEIEPEMEE